MSTGNDIVAMDSSMIAKAGKRRYYEKILSQEEWTLYEKAGGGIAAGEYTWLLWSVKEAVYKSLQRARPHLRFSPLKIKVAQVHPPASTAPYWTCAVADGARWLYTRTYFHGPYLHTIAATQKDFSSSCWGTGYSAQTTYASQTAGVRLLLLRQLGALLPGNTWRLEKSPEGIPLLFDEKRKDYIPVSFSHHGHYLGWSVCCERGGKTGNRLSASTLDNEATSGV